MLYVNTVRHLRPIQIYARLRKMIYRPRPAERPTPPRRYIPGEWITAIRKQPIFRESGRVRILNEDGEICCAENWNDTKKTKLWLYNLHYHDDLLSNSVCCKKSWNVDFIDRWVQDNTPGTGVGWEPYPLSRRIVNWIKSDFDGYELRSDWIESLATQLRWLDCQVEWHLLGNHLLSNAKALIFGGIFFRGSEAASWITKALAIFEQQLDEQILSDGGHVERSPMYHSIVLEDLLDVLNLLQFSGIGNTSLHDKLERKVPLMLHWLETMTHPDGRISFFNDAAFGIAADTSSLRSYAEKLGLALSKTDRKNLKLLSPSGYFRMERGGCTLIGDVAPVGPDYLPGHAHADTLSCEFSVGHERVIVNGGTSEYETGAQRHMERSTATHSTVSIDGANSSAVWKSFRVARRANVNDIRAESGSDLSIVSANHDGYRRLPGKPIHSRRWEMSGSKLLVADHVGCEDGRAIARFHLSPDVSATIDPGRQSGSISLASGRVVKLRASCPAQLEPSQYHPEFGLTRITEAIAIPANDGCIEASFSW